MFVEAMLVCGAAFTAFVAFMVFARARRRFKSAINQGPPKLAFDPAEIQTMLDSGKITPAEHDRLLAVLQHQRERQDAGTIRSGPRGVPVVSLNESRDENRPATR